jgi:AraC-like DNA-binding protein
MYGRGTHHPIIPKLLSLVESELHDLERLTISSAARDLHVSSFHLQHIIKRDLGCCFTELVRKRRIAHAKRLLLEKPELTIEEVAYRCGYQPPTMYRHFRSEFGMSPSAVRRDTVNATPPLNGMPVPLPSGSGPAARSARRKADNRADSTESAVVPLRRGS